MPFARKNIRSIYSRIYMFSAIFVMICVGVMIFGWVGQSRLLTNFREFEQTEETLAGILQIDQTVQELKARSEKYLHTGAASQLAFANRLHAELCERIKAGIGDSNEEDLAEILREMQSHLDVFKEQLALAAEERAIRTRLVEEDLPRSGERVKKAIARFESSDSLSSNGSSRSELKLAADTFADGQLLLRDYFITPQSDSFESSLVKVNEARNVVADLADSNVPEVAQLKHELLQSLTEYRQLATRAVQATRGYMFYSNVVMAAEVSEFVHYSKQLKSFVLARQQKNRLNRQNAVIGNRNLWVLASVGATILALVFSMRLSFAIVTPLGELTQTFLRLSEGEVVAELPAADRPDEIGMMAKAANVFSAKNHETKELLDRSRQLSQELSRKAEALEETNQELDNFAYVASHDLKSPLRGLNALSEWLQEDCSDILPDKSKTHLQEINRRVGIMQSLLDDLLDYSRVGRTDPDVEDIDLGELVENLRPILDNPEDVRLSVVGELPKFRTVRTPLVQALLNLIANAIKYNDKGPQGYVQVASKDFGDFYEFSVSDNGSGIAEQYHERIFQMFQRVGSRKVDGSGMGLAIAKKQIERYGGSISVESAENQGATFTFTWPKTLDLQFEMNQAEFNSSSPPEKKQSYA